MLGCKLEVLAAPLFFFENDHGSNVIINFFSNFPLIYLLILDVFLVFSQNCPWKIGSFDKEFRFWLFFEEQ